MFYGGTRELFQMCPSKLIIWRWLREINLKTKVFEFAKAQRGTFETYPALQTHLNSPASSHCMTERAWPHSTVSLVPNQLTHFDFDIFPLALVGSFTSGNWTLLVWSYHLDQHSNAPAQSNTTDHGAELDRTLFFVCFIGPIIKFLIIASMAWPTFKTLRCPLLMFKFISEIHFSFSRIQYL